mmetsp:Transcript_17043/g.19388  ORF Transcript_17043/g.19388 Transcript_17043/m.19388 type:complete len:542 (+) Transcript_17043:235-1860(+)
MKRDRREENELSLGAYMGFISHELKNPLHALQSVASLLEPSSEKQVKYLDLLQGSLFSLEEVLKTFTDCSKISNGKLKITPHLGKTDIGDLVRTSVKLYSHTLSSKVSMEVNIGEGISECYFLADRIRLQQILNNAISNAIKFTPTGRITVNVFYRDSNEELEVLVVDSGVGFDKDANPFLLYSSGFEDSNIHSKKLSLHSSGIGLYLSKALSDAMNGDISLRKNDGKPGSTFTFKLRVPRYRERSNSFSSSSVESLSSGLNRLTSTAELTVPVIESTRVLVVDDEPLNRMVISEMLQRIGINRDSIHCLSDGSQVESFLSSPWGRRFDPTVILMDVFMHEMDGPDTCERVRKLNSHIPVIAVTGSSDEKSELCGFGFDDVLYKPFTKIQLKSMIEKSAPIGHLIFTGIGGEEGFEILTEAVTTNFFKMYDQFETTFASDGQSAKSQLRQFMRLLVGRGMKEVGANTGLSVPFTATSIFPLLERTLDELCIPNDVAQLIMFKAREQVSASEYEENTLACGTSGTSGARYFLERTEETQFVL